MSMNAATHESHNGSSHHVHPQSMYFKAFIVLFVLMVGTVLASYLPVGDSAIASFAMNVLALTIACLKAITVILYFMGVKFSTRLTQMYAACGFLWFTLMFITFCDYMTRSWEPTPGWESGIPANALPRGPYLPNQGETMLPNLREVPTPPTRDGR